MLLNDCSPSFGESFILPSYAADGIRTHVSRVAPTHDPLRDALLTELQSNSKLAKRCFGEMSLGQNDWKPDPSLIFSQEDFFCRELFHLLVSCGTHILVFFAFSRLGKRGSKCS